MESSVYVISLIIVILGVPILVFGVLVQLGRYKQWYLYKGDPALSPKEFAYVCIPSGLAMIILGIALVLPTREVRQALFWGIDFPLTIATAVLLFWLPDWIKPAWVRWLEKNYGDILFLLLEEARKTPNWERHVTTQEGLEAWAAKVRDKYTLKPGEFFKVFKD